jgi:hypothetical protein
MDNVAKKTLLQKIPYGLYVCTSKDGTETSAMLCNWVAQASFDPPMMTLAVQNDSHSHAIIQRSRAFCLNFIPRGERDTAVHFAQHYDEVGDKLEDWDFRCRCCPRPLATLNSESSACLRAAITMSFWWKLWARRCSATARFTPRERPASTTLANTGFQLLDHSRATVTHWRPGSSCGGKSCDRLWSAYQTSARGGARTS